MDCCSVVSNSLWPHGAAQQASLSITVSWSLLKLMSIELMMPSNHLLSSPPRPVFSLSQHQGLFQWAASFIRWPKYWSFSSASVLPMNNQGWFSLGWTGLISLMYKGLSRVFTTVRKCQFFGTQPLWFKMDCQAHSPLLTWGQSLE